MSSSLVQTPAVLARLVGWHFLVLSIQNTSGQWRYPGTSGNLSLYNGDKIYADCRWQDNASWYSYNAAGYWSNIWQNGYFHAYIEHVSIYNGQWVNRGGNTIRVGSGVGHSETPYSGLPTERHTKMRFDVQIWGTAYNSSCRLIYAGDFGH